MIRDWLQQRGTFPQLVTWADTDYQACLDPLGTAVAEHGPGHPWLSSFAVLLGTAGRSGQLRTICNPSIF